MASSIPDYTKINFAIDKESAKKMIDFGVHLYEDRSEIRKINTKLYNSYNGVIDRKSIEHITMKTGELSSTPYISYRIGRNKIKQLIGEFLQIGIRSTVYTINPEAKKAKYEKYILAKGMSNAKPMIEKARQNGMNVYPGFKIPDPNEDKINSRKFKSTNEIIMQIILDWKILKDDMINIFLENWKQLILTSEVSGKLERDEYFNDIFRPIDPNNSIFIESYFDPFLKRSFIKGERRLMFKHEVLQEFGDEINNNVENKEAFDSLGGLIENQTNLDIRASEYMYEVFSFQFFGKRTTRTKKSKNKDGITYTKFIRDEDYHKNKKEIKKEIKNGKYKITNEQNDITVFEGSRIGSDLYLGIKEKNDNIVWMDDNGYDHVESDYIFGLFNTVNGVRVPLQEIVYEMEKIYNAIRRQLNVEISKLKGDMAVFDEAFMTSKNPLKKTIHDLAEQGITTMNSAKEGASNDDNENVIDRFVKTFRLGDNETIKTLLGLALDIEQTLDRVVGMNNDRQGQGNASSTATTNQNNVNASVSMTYDMFQFMSTYINEVLSRLIEKVKINWTWLENEDYGMVLSDEQWGYLKATKNLSNDSYASFITDGKFEFDVKRKLEQFFLQEINAQKLRTLDVAKFYNVKSFAASVKILQDAYDTLTQDEQKQEQAKSQANQEQSKNEIQATQQINEDNQQHDIDKIRVKGEEDRKTKSMEKELNQGAEVNKQMRDNLQANEVQTREIDQKNNELAAKERMEISKNLNKNNNSNN